MNSVDWTRQSSILALFHIGRVILDELTPLPQIPHLRDNIYPEDIFSPTFFSLGELPSLCTVPSPDLAKVLRSRKRWQWTWHWGWNFDDFCIQQMECRIFSNTCRRLKNTDRVWRPEENLSDCTEYWNPLGHVPWWWCNKINNTIITNLPPPPPGLPALEI